MVYLGIGIFLLMGEQEAKLPSLAVSESENISCLV